MVQLKQILCPVDFSDFSRRALDHASARDDRAARNPRREDP
jgi:hypothetical protein